MPHPVIDKVEQAIPRRMRERYAHIVDPVLDRANVIIEGKDDWAMSQRTALFAFTIRVFSALIAYLSQVLLARWMGSYEYGIFVVVWVTAALLHGTPEFLGFPYFMNCDSSCGWTHNYENDLRHRSPNTVSPTGGIIMRPLLNEAH